MSADEAIVLAIEGEDAAVYAYGVIGAHLSGAARDKASRALASHRLLRQTWQDRIDHAIAVPAAYTLPTPVTDTATARTLAGRIENALVPVYANLSAATTGEDRARAVTAAMECATRAVNWGSPPQPFPGS